MAHDPSPTRTTQVCQRTLASGSASEIQLVVYRDREMLWDLRFTDGSVGSSGGLCRWFSATKPLTAILIARAWEGGLLDLDEPVRRLLPEFATGGKDHITVRHLLTHTAGIRLPQLAWPTTGWDETIAAICRSRIEPRWRPGRDAGYHLASSWFILAELLRRLDGRSFENRVREDLFQPLGCDDSWVGVPTHRREDVEARIAPMWDTAESPPTRAAATASLAAHPGGGGLGPLRDLAAVWEMLRRGGQFNGVEILRPQSVEALLARHRVGILDRTFRVALDWGLGVIPNSARTAADADELPYHYGPHASPSCVGHSGNRSSVAFCDREFGLSVALWWNGLAAPAAHQQRVNATLAAVYTDLGLAPTAPGQD